MISSFPVTIEPVAAKGVTFASALISFGLPTAEVRGSPVTPTPIPPIIKGIPILEVKPKPVGETIASATTALLPIEVTASTPIGTSTSFLVETPIGPTVQLSCNPVGEIFASAVTVEVPVEEVKPTPVTATFVRSSTPREPTEVVVAIPVRVV